MVGRWFFMIIGTIFSITPAFVYWLAGYLAIQNDPTAPTIGDIVAFTTLQSRLFFPLGQLLNVQVEIQGALALFDRIFEYLELDPVIVDAPDAIDLAARPVAGRIRFRDVSFRYQTPPPVVANEEAGTDEEQPGAGAGAPDAPAAPASVAPATATPGAPRRPAFVPPGSSGMPAFLRNRIAAAGGFEARAAEAEQQEPVPAAAPELRPFGL